MHEKINTLKEDLKNIHTIYFSSSPTPKENFKMFETFLKHINIVSSKEALYLELETEQCQLLFIELLENQEQTLMLIENIKKMKPTLFIIILANKNDPETLLKCIELSIHGFLLLPLKEELLIKTLKSMVEKRKYEVKKHHNFAQQYLSLFEKATTISKTNLEGTITYVNDNFCEISGYSKEELLGKNHNMLRHEENIKELYTDLWNTIKVQKQQWKGMVKNKSKNNKTYYAKTVITPIKDLDEEIVEYIAMRESLDTIIDDKKHLLTQIEYNSFSILVMVQLDEFEMLDKFYSNIMVDQVERNFAFNLIGYLPTVYKFEHVYSLGEGKFALLTDFQSFESSQLNIQEYLNEFVNNVKNSAVTFDEFDFDFNITVSYAIGQYMLYEDAKAGLENAMASSSKLNFSNDLSIAVSQKAKTNLQMIKTVKIALDNYNIVSYFQPIINNKTQKIEKYESLVRLIDENENVISPFEFLTISKKANYYDKITERVLENSFKILHKINTELSINISMSDIEKQTTRNNIYKLLKEYKKDTHRIVFELLEDENVKDLSLIKEFIKAVKTQGVKIAIDDFGTGYSNFERLLEFEPDIVKIDGSLVKNIATDAYSRNIVETIVAFAKKQNIKTIAEYVENEDIFNILTTIGVDYSQGYHFGKPEVI
ncbi:MAG: EAL domain-containing protein [Arcobacteraceae bacterium]